MLTNPAERQASIDRLKAAEPEGGYQDISRVWYLLYFASATTISIAVAYYLADYLPKWLPPASRFFIAFASFMALGIFLMRRWNTKNNQV
jgi:hypothetical protein